MPGLPEWRHLRHIDREMRLPGSVRGCRLLSAPMPALPARWYLQPFHREMLLPGSVYRYAVNAVILQLLVQWHAAGDERTAKVGHNLCIEHIKAEKFDVAMFEGACDGKSMGSPSERHAFYVPPLM